MLERFDAFRLALRQIKRDDLLHLATEATAAVGILGSNPGEAKRRALTHGLSTGQTYGLAIERHLELAAETDESSVRADSYVQAAVLVRFCEELKLLGFGLTVDLPAGVSSAGLFRLADNAYSLRRCDGFARVTNAYRWLRDQRLDPGTAEHGRTPLDASYFAGTGAQMYKSSFDLERTIEEILREWARPSIGNEFLKVLESANEYWESDSRGSGFPARGRFEQAKALWHISRGDLAGADVSLRKASVFLSEYPSTYVEGQVERVSVWLSEAEVLAANGGGRTEETVAACQRALDELEGIRQRWAIVSRSPSPLSLVIRLILGDLAAVLATVPTASASVLGLRLSVIAKHSGFAELLRRQRDLLGSNTAAVLNDIVDLENQLAGSESVSEALRGRVTRKQADLRRELSAAVSEILAGLVLPDEVTDVAPILNHANGRIILDFVSLPTLQADPSGHSWAFRIGASWFRTTANGPGDVRFDHLQMGEGAKALLVDGYTKPYNGQVVPLVDVLKEDGVSGHQAWMEAANELLPEVLLDELSTGSAPVPQILICPHRELSRLPWSALVVGEEAGSKVRFIQRAEVLHTPFLHGAMLADAKIGSLKPVIGPALVRVVDDDLYGPNERIMSGPDQAAWGLRTDIGAIPLARCSIPVQSPEPLEGSVASSLEMHNDWGFVYIASHGGYQGFRGGFRQRLELPPEGGLTAGEALGLGWPKDVMFNACHVGELDDEDDAEPMGFVIAAMVNGARTVVGALHVVGGAGASSIGESVIRGLDGKTPLHVLLHRAQRNICKTHPVSEWAPLAAYVL